MLRFPFIILFTLAGSFAEDIFKAFKLCEIDECHKNETELKLVSFLKDVGLPSIEKIDEFCPSLFKEAECIEKKLLSCTGKALSNLKSSENINISIVATTTLNLRRVAHDLCNKNSNLHKNYERYIECTSKVFKEGNNECWAAGINNWDKYKAENRSSKRVESTDVSLGFQGAKDTVFYLVQENVCIEKAYQAACLAIQIKNKCGIQAKRLFTVIGFDGLEIIRYLRCNQVVHSESIASFLNSLEDREMRETLLNALQGADYKEKNDSKMIPGSRNFLNDTLIEARNASMNASNGELGNSLIEPEYNLQNIIDTLNKARNATHGANCILELCNSLIESINNLKNAINCAANTKNSGRTHVLASASIYILAVVLFSWLFLW